MVDLAKGGKDVNAVAADALALAATSTPAIGLLSSTFGKLTLDVLQTPMREFMEEGVKESEIKMNLIKYEGIRRVEYLINNDVFLIGKYFTNANNLYVINFKKL